MNVTITFDSTNKAECDDVYALVGKYRTPDVNPYPGKNLTAINAAYPAPVGAPAGSVWVMEDAPPRNIVLYGLDGKPVPGTWYSPV